MPIRILYTLPNFITAGSGRLMLDIIERLDRARFAPTVCVMKRGGHLCQEVERLGIPLMEAPFTVRAKPYHTLLFRAWRAAQIFRPRQFFAWHSFHYLDDYTEPIIARFAGARAWFYTKKNMSWNRRSWYLRTGMASGVAAQNLDMMRDFFSSRFFRHKCRYIPSGVDTKCYRPIEHTQLHLREQLGLQPETLLVGCVAHLVPVKGHPTLLRAVPKVPGLHLLLAGKPLDEQYTASLKQMALDLQIADRVHFLGDVRDVPSLLNELDFFVLPTWAQWRMEGCPVALLEAMACGLACVASDIPGSRDVVEHGQSGWLVPPEDEVALAEALNKLGSSPELRFRLGEQARLHTEQRFSVEHQAAAYEALYSEVIRPKKSRSAALVF